MNGTTEANRPFIYFFERGRVKSRTVSGRERKRVRETSGWGCWIVDVGWTTQTNKWSEPWKCSRKSEWVIMSKYQQQHQTTAWHDMVWYECTKVEDRKKGAISIASRVFNGMSFCSFADDAFQMFVPFFFLQGIYIGGLPLPLPLPCLMSIKVRSFIPSGTNETKPANVFMFSLAPRPKSNHGRTLSGISVSLFQPIWASKHQRHAHFEYSLYFLRPLPSYSSLLVNLLFLLLGRVEYSRRIDTLLCTDSIWLDLNLTWGHDN